MNDLAVDGCPDPEVLSAFAAGAVPPTERDPIAAHLDGCASCRQLVSALAATDGTRPSSDLVDLTSGDAIGRYVLGDRIGMGAMGVVWAARDPELDRTVAIKLLHTRSGQLERGDEDRLRREAQAMARLHHPNVVVIHELGAANGRLFCAMELVSGETLRRWWAGRAWRDIVRALRDAGRGLAAVHRAGLVHRDFKPDNVLISTDGRVLVSDFGLAQFANEHAGANPGASAPGTAPVDALTRTGAIVGTPAYMAAELLEGDEASPASDQFSFCVTLYEALFGARPFPSKTIEDLATRLRQPPAPPPARLPGGGRCPRRLRNALLRGLQRAPGDRFPSMDALVTELDRVLARRRGVRVAMVAGAIAIASVAVVATVLATRPEDRGPAVERDAEARAHRAWNPTRRASLERAFSATGHPAAADTSRAVAARLDGRAREWIVARVGAAKAAGTERGGELLERRVSCLEARADELDALVDAFTTATARVVVDHAVDAIAALPPLSRCDETRQLDIEALLLADPDKRTDVAAVRNQIAVARAASDTAQSANALTAARAADASARATGLKPLIAEAAALLVHANIDAGELGAAETAARELIPLAAELRDHATVAHLWVMLIEVLLRLDRVSDAAALEIAARAAAAQAGGGPLPEGELEYSLAMIALQQGRYPEAIERYARAAIRFREMGQAGAKRAVDAEQNVAAVKVKTGDLPGARASLDAALASSISTYGPRHPHVASIEHNLAEVARLSHDHAEAEAHGRAALAIRTAMLGETHHETASSYMNLASVLRSLHRLDEAREHLARARIGYEQAYSPQHRRWVPFEIDVGEIELEAKNFVAATEAFERAVAVARVALPPGSQNRTVALNNLAWAWCERGAGDKALEYVAEAEANVAASKAPPVPGLVAAIADTRARAQALVGQGQTRRKPRPPTGD